MTTRQIKERKKMVLAMEYIARHINDESVFMGWLMCGVPDGDIPVGTLDDLDVVDDYDIDTDNFSELMQYFLVLMERAKKSGGLQCGGAVSK